MSRKHNVDEIDLKLYMVEFYDNEGYTGIELSWTSNIGFGVYNALCDKKSGRFILDSECMDSKDDKAFIKRLAALLKDEVEFLDKIIDQAEEVG